MSTPSAPRKFIFDTADKKSVKYANGYYTLYFPAPIHCTKISVLECTLLHSFYNVDYYNNEIELVMPSYIPNLGDVPYKAKFYLTPGHYKTINDIILEFVTRLKEIINARTAGLWKDDNIKITLNDKTYRLSFQIIDFRHKINLTFTNSYKLFGFAQKEETPSLIPHLDLIEGFVFTTPFLVDIVHNPAIYFRSQDLHTGTIYNSHVTNIFFRMPVNDGFLKWMHYTNSSPECTYFLLHGSLNQLTIRATDYEGNDVFLNNGDFKFEFVVN